MSQTKMYQGCLFFLTGVVLALGYDDLSKNKVATQSTTFPHGSNAPNTYVASNVVDRDIRTCMRTNPIGTTYPDRTVWWKVDLGGVYNIYSVNILFKNFDGEERRQQGRFAGFSIYVSSNGARDNSSLCYKDGPELPALNFTTTCITSGRYVSFYNERLPGVTYPDEYVVYSVYTELCEVTVHGCRASGVYGNSCKEGCPINCRYNVCHIQKGICFGCAPGWIDTTCNRKCDGGWYGTDCKQQCSGRHCRDNAVCNHVTGQCDEGCAAGWRGSLCDTVCRDGTYGNSCVYNCSGNCLNDFPCNRQTGQCDMGCKPGYINTFCNEHCPPEYYGNECKKACSGHCLNNTVCDHITGTCTNGCQAGYVGRRCKDNAVCNHVTGQCDGGCAAGWRGALCDKVCKDGTYGNSCVYNCSGNCLNGFPCNRQTGLCDMGCKPGYINTFCSEHCPPEYYGNECKKACSGHCLNNTVCDHITGTCTNGCQAGYVGKLCNNACKDGYYGQNCLHACSSNCKTCKYTDGTCSCQAGWTGSNCSTGCIKSYGENCLYPCSKHCVNQTCNRFHGICQFGCESGYHGQKCDQEFLSTSSLSVVSSGFIGASVGACVIIVLVVVRYMIRRIGVFKFKANSSNPKDATYAEVENQRSGDSTYQELSVTINQELTRSESDKAYQNLALQ